MLHTLWTIVFDESSIDAILSMQMAEVVHCPMVGAGADPADQAKGGYSAVQVKEECASYVLHLTVQVQVLHYRSSVGNLL